MNATIRRLRDAMNAHDLEAIAALFAPDYRSEQPVHPNRGFGGRDQVVENWAQMFRGVPDLQVGVVKETTDGTTTWSEWVWRGSHADGRPFLMKGATVMGLRDDGLIAWARLYMEPVEQDSAPIDQAVRQLSGTS
ncbi:nuclear transport factor 2 family protein [Geodermatophilus sp. URMC 64]